MEGRDAHDGGRMLSYSTLDEAPVEGEAVAASPSTATQGERGEHPAYNGQGGNRSKRVRPDSVDIMRTWSGIIVGGLLGILIVLVAFQLLQAQRPPLQPTQQGVEGAATAGSVPTDRGTGIQESSTGGNVQAEKNSALPPAPRVDRYPPDFALQTIDGEVIKLSELRGKPVWINFWATWCPPCRAEMPEMKQRYAKLKEQGLVIIGVDVGEDTEIVNQFVTSKGFDWTFVVDDTNDISQQYLVSGIPAHFFVGRDGLIKAVQMGGIPGNMMDRHLATIIGR
ncbi:MAG: TlpA disulfide reductase family protein [Chloroflexia bacterium]